MGMVLEQLPAQMRRVEMYVNLGRGYRLMAKHLLDCPEIGSTLQKMGGETMAEGMRRDRFGNPGILGQLFDYKEYHDACQPIAPAVEEKDILRAVLRLRA